MPDWKTLLKNGAPAAIAVYLVWWSATSMSSELSATHAELRAHSNATDLALRALDRQSQQTEALTSLMRQICINTAANGQQRSECVR